MRDNRVRKVTLTAVFSAFSIVFLYLAAVFPTGQLGFLGVASLFGIAAVCEYKIAGGIFVFAVTSIVGFLIIPDKASLILYVSFFGYYPVLKALAEKCSVRALEWVIKLGIFNAALSLVLFVFKIGFFDFDFGDAYYIVAYALANVVFVCFDVGVSRVLTVYMARIFPKIHRY